MLCGAAVSVGAPPVLRRGMTRSWCLRRVGRSGGSGDAADAGRTGELVGVGAAGGGAAAAGGAGPGRHAAGRPGVLRTVRAVLRPASGPAVDADGEPTCG